MTDEEDLEALKQQQRNKAIETISWLVTAETCAGAGLILGLARGRLDVLLDLGLLTRAEYTGLRESFKQQFEARWPYLSAELPPQVRE